MRNTHAIAITPITETLQGFSDYGGWLPAAFDTDLAVHYGQIANDMRALGLVPPSALPVPGRR